VVVAAGSLAASCVAGSVLARCVPASSGSQTSTDFTGWRGWIRETHPAQSAAIPRKITRIDRSMAAL
jgi:hypothetical protein